MVTMMRYFANFAFIIHCIHCLRVFVSQGLVTYCLFASSQSVRAHYVSDFYKLFPPRRGVIDSDDALGVSMVGTTLKPMLEMTVSSAASDFGLMNSPDTPNTFLPSLSTFSNDSSGQCSSTSGCEPDESSDDVSERNEACYL
jgi:hypothetical protein